MTATSTETIQFETVSRDSEAVPGRDFFLETLDVAVFELNDLATSGADQVVVVPFVRHIVVLSLSAEMSGLCQAGLAEKIECTVDRR